MSNIFAITALLNEGPHRFSDFTTEDKLIPIDEEFTVTADSEEEALEILWAIGNKMEADEEGTEWPRMRRSLSVGDVLVVASHRAWKCDIVGWVEIPDRDVLRGLLFGCPQ